MGEDDDGQFDMKANGPDTAEPTSIGTDRDWTSGWRVWILLGGLLGAFLVIPWALILLPSVRGSVRLAGLSFRDAYLVVPLLPAIGLGALGVWTALRSGRP